MDQDIRGFPYSQVDRLTYNQGIDKRIYPQNLLLGNYVLRYMSNNCEPFDAFDCLINLEKIKSYGRLLISVLDDDGLITLRTELPFDDQGYITKKRFQTGYIVGHYSSIDDYFMKLQSSNI